MNIKDKIGCMVLEYLEERCNLKIKKDDWLDIEQEIGKEIFKELNHWLKWDIDLSEFRD